jgi:hypothetical protein
LTAHVAAHPDLDVVLRGAGVVFAIQIVGAALSYFALVLLARWIGAGQYGVYAFYIAPLKTGIPMLTRGDCVIKVRSYAIREKLR